MKRILFLLIMLFNFTGFPQQIVNGSFEENYANSTDQINMSNLYADSIIKGIKAFGTQGNIDIIHSRHYGTAGAADGKYYVAITGGRTDIFSLKFDTPLHPNTVYEIEFYVRSNSAFSASPIQIGLSHRQDDFGEFIYQTGAAPPIDIWTKHTFTFTSIGATYLTVQMPEGGIGQWAHVDAFKLKLLSTSAITKIDTCKNNVSLPAALKLSDSLNGRKQIIKHVLTTNKSQTKILVWDKNAVDGDLINLYLNGVLLKKNILLSKVKKELALTLNEGANWLSMEAVNLGTSPPNTAALAFNDEPGSLLLISDLQTSSVVQINLNAGP